MGFRDRNLTLFLPWKSLGARGGDKPSTYLIIDQGTLRGKRESTGVWGWGPMAPQAEKTAQTKARGPKVARAIKVGRVAC